MPYFGKQHKNRKRALQFNGEGPIITDIGVSNKNPIANHENAIYNVYKGKDVYHNFLPTTKNVKEFIDTEIENKSNELLSDIFSKQNLTETIVERDSAGSDNTSLFYPIYSYIYPVEGTNNANIINKTHLNIYGLKYKFNGNTVTQLPPYILTQAKEEIFNNNFSYPFDWMVSDPNLEVTDYDTTWGDGQLSIRFRQSGEFLVYKSEMPANTPLKATIDIQNADITNNISFGSLTRENLQHVPGQQTNIKFKLDDDKLISFKNESEGTTTYTINNINIVPDDYVDNFSAIDKKSYDLSSGSKYYSNDEYSYISSSPCVNFSGMSDFDIILNSGNYIIECNDNTVGYIDINQIVSKSFNWELIAKVSNNLGVISTLFSTHNNKIKVEVSDSNAILTVSGELPVQIPHGGNYPGITLGYNKTSDVVYIKIENTSEYAEIDVSSINLEDDIIEIANGFRGLILINTIKFHKDSLLTWEWNGEEGKPLTDLSLLYKNVNEYSTVGDIPGSIIIKKTFNNDSKINYNNFEAVVDFKINAILTSPITILPNTPYTTTITHNDVNGTYNFHFASNINDYEIDDYIDKGTLSIKIISNTISCYYLISVGGDDYMHMGHGTLDLSYGELPSLTLITGKSYTVDIYKSYVKFNNELYWSYNSLQESVVKNGDIIYKGTTFKLLNGISSGVLGYRYFTLDSNKNINSTPNPGKIVCIDEDGNIEYFDELIISKTEPSNTNVLWKDISNNCYKTYNDNWGIHSCIVLYRIPSTNIPEITLNKFTDLNNVVYKISNVNGINVGSEYRLKINGEIYSGSVSIKWGDELIENVTDFDNDITIKALYCNNDIDKCIYIIGNNDSYSGEIESVELYEYNLVPNGEFNKLGWSYNGTFKCGLTENNPVKNTVSIPTTGNGNISIDTTLKGETTYIVSLDYISNNNTTLSLTYDNYTPLTGNKEFSMTTASYSNRTLQINSNSFIGSLYNVSVTRSFIMNSDWKNSLGWVLSNGCEIGEQLRVNLKPEEGSNTSASQTIDYIMPGQQWNIKTLVSNIYPQTEVSILVNDDSIFYYKNEQKTEGEESQNESTYVNETFTVNGSIGSISINGHNNDDESIQFNVGNLILKPINLCRNSDFSNSDYWVFGNGSAIQNKTLSINSLSSTSTTQPLKLISNTKYDIEYTILNYVSGEIKVGIDGNFGEVRTSNGIFKDVVEFNGDVVDCNFVINVPSRFVGSITNIKITPHNEIYDNNFGVMPSWNNGLGVGLNNELPLLSNSFIYTNAILYQNQTYEITFDLEINELNDNPKLVLSIGTLDINISIPILDIETKRYTETFSTGNFGVNLSTASCILFINASGINGVMKNVSIKTKNILTNSDFSIPKNWQIYYDSTIPSSVSYPSKWVIYGGKLRGSVLSTNDIIFYKKKEFINGIVYNGSITVDEIDGDDIQLMNGDTPITVTPSELTPGETPTGNIYKAGVYTITPFIMDSTKILKLNSVGNTTNINISNISITAISNTAVVDEEDFNDNNSKLSKNITEFNIRNQGTEFVNGKLVAVSIGDKGYITGVYSNGKISNINRENILIKAGGLTSDPIISNNDLLTTHNIEYIYLNNSGVVYITNKEPIMSEQQPILDEDEVWFDLRNKSYSICKDANIIQVQLISRGLVGLDSNFNSVCVACSSMKGAEKLQQINNIKVVISKDRDSLIILPASNDYSDYMKYGSYTENYLNKDGGPFIKYNSFGEVIPTTTENYIYLKGTSYGVTKQVIEHNIYRSSNLPVWDETKQIFVNPSAPSDRYICEVYFDNENKISEIYPIDSQYDIILTNRTYKRTVFRDVKKPLDVYLCSGGGAAMVYGNTNITDGGTSSIIGNGINIECSGGKTDINGYPGGYIQIDNAIWYSNGHKGEQANTPTIDGDRTSFGCPITRTPTTDGFVKNISNLKFGFGGGCGIDGSIGGGSGAVVYTKISPLKLYKVAMIVGEGGTNTDIGEMASGSQGVIAIKLY